MSRGPVTALVPADDASVTALLPDGSPEAWLVNAGPPGNEAVWDLLEEIGDERRIAGFIATDLDEEHVGALPEIESEIGSQCRFFVGDAEGEAFDTVRKVAHHEPTDTNRLRFVPHGSPIRVGEASVIPVTDPSKGDHPDSMVLDVRTWEPALSAYDPANLLITGGLAADEEETVVDCASKVYSHYQPFDADLGLPGAADMADRRRLVARDHQVFLDETYLDGDPPPEFHATVLDHRHRDDGPSDLLTDGTVGVVPGGETPPDLATAGPALDDVGDPDAVWPITLDFGRDEIHVSPARDPASLDVGSDRLVDRQAERLDGRETDSERGRDGTGGVGGPDEGDFGPDGGAR